MASLKDTVAMELARSHWETDPDIASIYRLLSDREDDPEEPLKILEVNPNTMGSGIEPIRLGADPENGVPFPLVFVDISPDDFARILAKELKLPKGWRLGPELEREPSHAS